MSNIIEVNQLTERCSSSEQPTVRGVSFAVRRGELFGVLGPAGAGKTTVLALLAGQHKPGGGTATIAGFDLVRQAKDVKHCCRLVPQQLRLIPWLSIQDNLQVYGRLHGISGQQLRPRIAETLQLVGLDACYSPGVPKQASGMQRQLGLAAALLHQPEILLLDEPTADVDRPSDNNLLDAVAELNRRGLTIVYATRHADIAARLCHRVALLDQGRIIALDTPHALQEMLAVQGSLDAVFLELAGKPLRG